MLHTWSKLNTLEITQWVDRTLNSLGNDALYLVDVAWYKKSHKLEVFIESDEDLTLGEVQRISRQLQKSLDEGDFLGDSYRLDVSSPGIDRPLKLKRQYMKNIGRVVSIELDEGEKITARLKAVDDEGLVVEPEIPGYKKKKPTYGSETSIKWKNIKQTIVQIRF